MFRLTRKNLVYFVILIIAFFLFFTRSAIFTSWKFQFINTTSLPIRILSFPFKEVKKILFYHRTYDEYQRLRGEVDHLKGRLVGLDEVIRENTRLEKLLEFRRRLIYPSVAANVIGRDPSYWNSSMIIDKGKDAGLKEGQPVVNALGVVGKIAEVSQKKAKVILLTDPQFSVAALIQKPRESGLVSGSLQGVCRIRYLNEGIRIRPGDKVVTSKLSSSFPEGLLIGEIIRVQESSRSPAVEAIVEPAVAISQIEEVLVILEN